MNKLHTLVDAQELQKKFSEELNFKNYIDYSPYNKSIEVKPAVEAMMPPSDEMTVAFKESMERFSLRLNSFILITQENCSGFMDKPNYVNTAQVVVENEEVESFEYPAGEKVMAKLHELAKKHEISAKHIFRLYDGDCGSEEVLVYSEK